MSTPSGVLIFMYAENTARLTSSQRTARYASR
jgi:hypothetical protein